ncbi:hypothetical protein [Saccharopolyspora pogona]|uniref:hypothetical protein n=1 Tax=Saccharopolyspora pogona TaxID=333966 RepID=UPI0016844979|nr:hypothetical protein [Saccharopolyspora pogona]
MFVQLAVAVAAQMPNPGGPIAPPGSEKIMLLMQWGLWIGFACCIGGIALFAAKMAISHRQGFGGGDEATGVWKPLVACIVLSNIFGLAAGLATFG